MERKIGETFEFEGKWLKVKEEVGCDSCTGCYFLPMDCSNFRSFIGVCRDTKRSDIKGVVFEDITYELEEQPQEVEQPQEEQPQEEQPQKLNLCEILKDCPTGTVFYSTLHGKVNFVRIDKEEHPIIFMFTDKGVEFTSRVSSEGKYLYTTIGECILFPSKDQRDWSKFTAPWYKKEKFDPKTLKPFDKVLSRYDGGCWSANLFSHIEEENNKYHGTCSFVCNGSLVKFCIPYNDETKHLVGTKDEAPEYYRYWEE